MITIMITTSMHPQVLDKKLLMVTSEISSKSQFTANQIVIDMIKALQKRTFWINDTEERNFRNLG